MILDERTELVDSNDPVMEPIVGPGGARLTVTASATTQIGDILPLSVARDLGTGKPLWLVVIAATDITVGATTSTLTFNLITGSASSGSPPTITSPVIIDSSLALPVAVSGSTTLTAGKVLWLVPIPPETLNAYNTLLGLSHTNGGVALSAGCKIDAFITSDIGRWKAVADATN